jgi:predicted RecB family nuclease
VKEEIRVTPDQGAVAFPRLSKSRYLSGLQCHRRLCLDVHSRELASAMDKQTEARLEMGIEVGQLARQRFPGGRLVEADPLNVPGALKRTAALRTDASVPAIFEGLFEFDHVLVRVDILERVGKDAWRLIEVKSSTQVRGDHLDDVAIQAYVLSGSGVRLIGLELMHINDGYVFPGGDLDLGQLFLREDVMQEVTDRQAEVPTRLAAMRNMLAASPAPAIEPDHHCFEPLACPFWDHCTQAKPARWIYYLPGGRRTFQELVNRGVQTIDEIPAGFKLSPIQQRMKDNVEWIGPGLRGELEAVRYPVHHLDFETFMPAIPRYPNTRPYQTIPFQWSNHVMTSDGRVRHEEYLCADQRDPRGELARTLLESVGQEGSIGVYSSYERRMLSELADALPELKPELDRVTERLWDLLPIIRAHYYHPGFNGSFSMKSVLPALVASLDYSDLEIQEGGMASLQYSRMMFEVLDDEERARIRAALLNYCERDTLAMVELRKALLARAGKIRP